MGSFAFSWCSTQSLRGKFVSPHSAEHLLKFVDAMWLFFEVRGSFTPAIQFFGEAANKLTSQDAEVVCAREQLRARQAWFTALIGLPEEGLKLALESINMLRQHKSPSIVVDTYSCVNINAIFMNNCSVVIEAIEAMMARAAESGDAWERGFALIWQGFAFLIQQQIDRAAQAGQEAVTIFEQLDDPFGVSVATTIVLGSVSMAVGNIRDAKIYFQRGV